MLLKPPVEEKKKMGRPIVEKEKVLPPSETIDQSAAQEILHTVGLAKSNKIETSNRSENINVEEARRVFTESGATLEEAASAMFRVMRNGESEGAIVSAAKTIATIFGALKDLEGQIAPSINIVIASNKPDNSVVNLLMPSR